MTSEYFNSSPISHVNTNRQNFSNNYLHVINNNINSGSNISNFMNNHSAHSAVSKGATESVYIS